MPMRPRLRKLALTAHVTSSVGWLGAVAAFLALGVIGLTTDDAQTARAVFLVMEPAGWAALVPLAFASLLTGLIQALGTTWGLFRHYWVLFKLLMNVAACAVLLAYMQTLGYLADAAADPAFSADDLGDMRGSPMIHSALALVLLLAATVLAVYKPRGTTRYGQRRLREDHREQRVAAQP
jgi:hypothetical protein